MGDPEVALPLARRLVEENASLHGPVHPDTLSARCIMARQLGAAGEPAEALQVASDVVALAETVCSQDDPVLLDAIFERCAWIRVVHGPVAGADAFSELLRQLRDLAEPNPWQTAFCLWNLAGALTDSGDFAAAVPLCGEALSLGRQMLGDDHQVTLMFRRSHINALAATGDPSAAEQKRQLTADCVRVLGVDHPVTRTLVQARE
jgi:hypothetical protein